MKRILISIDGTGSELSDAEQQTNPRGETIDDALSNVAKLHLLAGGRAENDRWRFDDQVALYYAGVGARGNKLQGAVEQAFARSEPEVIRDEAYAGLCEHYEDGDAVYLFGFSRGAAIARWLARHIEDNGVNGHRPRIALLGCWDTVVAWDKPDPRDEPPSSTMDEDGRIARNVELAWHLLALDERRVTFRPTVMGHEERVHEVWFAGVHSDVGGSYLDHALADVPLQFMLDRAAEHGVAFLAADAIDYGDLGGDVTITESDVALSPDAVNGLLHAQDDSPSTDDRLVHVAVGDAVSDLPPLIHHTVLDRMDGNADGYRSAAFEAVERYRVLEADGSIRASR